MSTPFSIGSLLRKAVTSIYTYFALIVVFAVYLWSILAIAMSARDRRG